MELYERADDFLPEPSAIFAAHESEAICQISPWSSEVNRALRQVVDGVERCLPAWGRDSRREESGDGRGGVGSAANGRIAVLQIGRPEVCTERGEHHLRSALGLEEYAPVCVDAGYADHVGVSGGIKRRRGGSVVADGGHDEIAALDERADDKLEHRIFRADQTDVNHRDALIDQPAESGGEGIDRAPVGDPQ